MTEPGRLIAIEGNDGTGKSTLCRHVAEALRARQEPTVLVQRYLRPEVTSLFLRLVDADRITHDEVFLLSAADYWTGVQEAILDPIEAGATVITDRYVYTHFVHFGSRGVDQDLMRIALDGFRPADVVVLLEAPPDITYARVLGHMKPDMWESGLDHRLGISIGEAARRWRAGEIGDDQLRRYFFDQQSDMARRFEAAIPAASLARVDSTVELDVARLVDRIDALCPPARSTIGRR